MVHSHVRVCVCMCHFVNFVNFSDSKTISYLNLDNPCVVSSWENKKPNGCSAQGWKASCSTEFHGTAVFMETRARHCRALQIERQVFTSHQETIRK